MARSRSSSSPSRGSLTSLTAREARTAFTPVQAPPTGCRNRSRRGGGMRALAPLETRRAVAQVDDPETGTRDELRWAAQLDMLHSLAATLNMLGDVEEIASAITAELRTIIDYHNCRVYLLQPD